MNPFTPRSFPVWAAVTALAALAAVTLHGAIARTDARTDAAPRAATARGPLQADEQNNIAVFKAVSPSVVHITTLQNRRDMFSMSVSQVPSGTGSGFVWDERGHIVTNFHVIQGASAAQVLMADGSEWKASLVGAFADRDLAVLKIEAPREKLPPIPPPNSNRASS